MKIILGIIVYLIIFKIFSSVIKHKRNTNNNKPKQPVKNTIDPKINNRIENTKIKEVRQLIKDTKKELKTRTVSISNHKYYKTKQQIGQEYEKRVGKYYENKGYKVTYRGIELGLSDGGIDLIARNNYKILLIQCKYWKEKESITHNMVKEFFGNCSFYIDNNNIEKSKTTSIYIVPDHRVISRAAYYVFKDNYANCRYQVIK